MGQKELVGKRVLVKLGVLPRETQEQPVPESVFGVYSIVEVVGYVSGVSYQVIIDGKGLGWGSSALGARDVIMKKAESYWLVNISSIVEVLK